MSRSRQIAINAASQSGLTVLSVALGLLVVPFLISRLGADGYGLIAITMAISSACALADFGISGALGRQLAEALAKQDPRTYNQLVSTATGLNLLSGCVCGAGVFMAAGRLASLFLLPAALYEPCVFLVRTYVTANVVFTFLMPAPRAVLASHHRFDTASLIDGIRRLFETAGLFLALAGTGAGLGGWAAVTMISQTVTTIALWRAAAKVHLGLRVTVSSMSFSRVRELFGLGSQFTLLGLSSQLSINADPFILTACLGPASVGLYRPPAQVFSALSPFVMTLANQLHPLATRAHVEGKRNELQAILVRGTKYTMLVGAPCCAMLIALSCPLNRLWLGTVLGDQYRVCAELLIIQAIIQLGVFAGGTHWPVLLGMRRTSFAAYGRFAFAVLNIVSSWLLVRYTHLGILGVLLPTMCIELLWRVVLISYICRALELGITRYFRESYLSALIVSSATAALGWIANTLVAPVHIWSLASITAMLGSICMALIWLVGFSPDDRLALIGIARFYLSRAGLRPRAPVRSYRADSDAVTRRMAHDIGGDPL